MHLSSGVSVRLTLTMWSLAQGRDHHQRVRNTVRRQQQRQLAQDEPAQASVRTARLLLVALRRRGEVCLFHALLHRREGRSCRLVSRRGRHDEGEQSEAFMQTHGTGLHLRQTRYELEEQREHINTSPPPEKNVKPVVFKTS